MAYTTRANVEAYLGTTFSSSTQPTDTTVDGWVTDVDTEIDNLTGTTFTSTEFTEYIDIVNSTNKFLVSNYPLISLTSASYNDYTNADPVFNPNWVAFDNSRVVGDVVITDKVVQGDNKVKLVYNAGHTSVPPEVEYLATLMIVKKIMSGDDSANGATDSLSIGSISLTSNVGTARFLNLDNNIKETLKRVGKFKTVFKSKSNG